MLQIKGVSKTYRTGTLVQQALDHVSLNLRDNEFVAILGQSGSGKTTLLNIIGGLDRYDEGDLIINGVSTKRYTDRDWDAYRNHTVGFVFQSYNLIPHQTLLANVELALTIGGISRRERTARAQQALEKVGLGEQVHKKPFQLSGGQMQRVAIARALVNDPDILLADEPTGALDSDTSLQVMDLLKEVARDRLVVMVTHNPELAEQYATRIVNLRDGVILSDTDPYEPHVADEGTHRSMGRASMSFLTALALSFNNLRTKMARTVLVSFAGSIGIIGIAMILSLSSGVDRYIQNVEEEALEGYPLQITDSSFDLTTMYSAQMGVSTDTDDTEQAGQKDMQEWRTVSRILSRVTTNDLASLKDFLDGGGDGIDDYARAVEYDYNISPQIFLEYNGGVRQVNPDKTFSALGLGAEGMSGMLSSFSNTSSFRAMPEKEELYRGSYDVVAGRWPEDYNELVVVLTQTGRVVDVVLYAMGLKDPYELDAMVNAFAAGETPDTGDGVSGEYDYDELLGKSFRLLCASDWYVYDPDYDVWTDKSGDNAFMKELVSGAEELKVVGIVQPREDAASAILSIGIGYQPSLVRHLMARAAESPVVLAQMAAPESNVLTGRLFGDEEERGALDMSALFSVDASAFENAFSFDTSALDVGSIDLSDVDLSGMIDPSDFSLELPEMDPQDLTSLFSGLDVELSPEDMQQMFTALMDGYSAYLGADPQDAMAGLGEAVGEYLASDDARVIIETALRNAAVRAGERAITAEQLQEVLAAVLEGYPAYVEENDLDENDVPYLYVGQYLRSDAALRRIEAEAAALRAQVTQMLSAREVLDDISTGLLDGYSDYASRNGLPDPFSIESSFADYLASPEGRALLEQSIASVVDTDAVNERVSEMYDSYSDAMSTQIQRMMTRVGQRMMAAVSAQMGTAMSGMADSFRNAFSFDESALASAFNVDFTGEELRDLMTSLFSTEKASYENNLKKLGYADEDVPSTITIYPRDFESKGEVKRILDGYNERMRTSGQEEKAVQYTDMVDTLMSSVTDIVNAISYVLIAFVAISLVVSSIMIGVITYISVLERRKEIGILRAIGASKRNISEVFNAETFIIGALAGVFGIVITLTLLLPVNHIIHSLTGQTSISAVLPPMAAVWLILLSIVLTLIGGIIPSQKAARSDPVTALRSE